jgi:Tol biopolymer transport system component
VNPYWSSDSQHVLYFDRPTSQDQAGIWGINLQGDSPEFVTAQWAVYSNDQALRAFPSSGQTIVERISDGQRWTIPNEGRSVLFSMDGMQIGWTAGRNQPPFDSATRQIWISQADGSSARQVMSVLSGGISGWFPDGRLLVNGRLENIELGQALWVLTPPSIEGGDWNAAELLQAKRIRGAILSPDGTWLAYVSAFSGDPNQDGLWLLHIQSGEKRRLELFGAYRWRDASHLLVIPLELDQPFHRLLQVNLPGGGIETLTKPETAPFKIANGDWSVSPDGSHVAYVSALDGNIWVIDLP